MKPEQVIDDLGFHPTHIYEKGKPNPGGRPYDGNALELRLDKVESDDFHAPVRALLLDSGIRLDRLEELTREYTGVICFGVFMDEFNEFIRIERETSELLHKYHLLLTFDVYYDGDEE